MNDDDAGRRAPLVELVELGGVWVHRSIPHLAQQVFAERPHEVVEMRLDRAANEWRRTTRAQTARRVRDLTLGLLELGVRKGDRVAIVSATRSEWGRADLAILHAGAVTVGIYPTLPADDVAWHMEHAGAVVAFVEDAEQLEKVRATRDALPLLRDVIVFDPEGVTPGRGERTLADLEALGSRLGEADLDAADARFEAAWRAVGHDDLATIIYTSGTTGRPKGAMLTHGNLCFTVRSASGVLPWRRGDRSVVFLPMAHALQRVATYGGLLVGACAIYNTAVERLMDDLREVEPDVQVSVPRLWEKLHAKIREVVASAPPHRRRIFDWGLSVGRKTAPYRQRGESLPLSLRLADAAARRVVHGPLKARVFGRNIRYLTSGAAPIAVDILEFFWALDLLVLEGWGLTETAAPATINRPDDFRFGTVGKPIPGTIVKVAPDGELLVRGPGVFRGYFKDPQASTEAFTEDLFFRTGDLGAIDREGFVRITGRKKDLIVLSNGKKIPPQNIELLIKQAPLVAHALVHGDRRNYLVGLLVLEPDALGAFARERGLPGAPASGPADAAQVAALSQLPEVAAEVDRQVRPLIDTLAPFEQLKRWRILPEVWSPDEGSLTPTLKVKRAHVERLHRELLDSLYADDRVKA